MATLYQRHGNYYARFHNSNRQHTRKRFSLQTTKKRIARRKLTKLEDAYNAGEFDPWVDDPWSYDKEPFEHLTLKEAVDRFLSAKEDAGCSDHTIRTYREVLRLLKDRSGAGQAMTRITSAALRRFIRDDSLAQATQHKRYGHLLTFFRWAESENYLRDNPLEAVSRPRKPEKLPKAITQAELQTLCDTVHADYQEKRSHNWIRKDQLIWRIPLFWFAYYTGMRGEELARLRWTHIDEESGLIIIRKQKNRKEQTIPLNRKAADVLTDLEPGDPHDYVFRSPGFERQKRDPTWFRENASAAFRKARRKAGLRSGLSFHSLRHGFCTALAEAGKSAVVIKEAARHADISTSMRYVHMANEHLKAEVDDVFT